MYVHLKIVLIFVDLNILKLLWKYFVTLYYCFKSDLSSEIIEQKIQHKLLYFRELLYCFFASKFTIPKNHATSTLQQERVLFGPCRWFETSSKESKHKYYREAKDIAPNKNVEFYICKKDCRLHFFKYMKQGKIF